MKETKLNVLITDDHSVFRLGLETLLREVPMVKEVYQAENGQIALELLEKHPIDIVLMDIEMPVLNGIEMLTKIQEIQGPSTPKVIVLSMFHHKQYLLNVYEKGIAGYLLKDAGLNELIRAFELIAEGQSYFSPKVSETLFQALLPGSVPKSQVPLSEQEKTVLRLICQQYTSEEIAEKMFLSPLTIKKHRQNIMEKTESENMVGLVLYALKKGIYVI